MSLLDDLAAATNHTNGPICSVAAVLASLPPAEADAIRTAIDAKVIHSTVLGTVLGKNGLPVKAFAIQRHRRGDCGCRTS